MKRKVKDLVMLPGLLGAKSHCLVLRQIECCLYMPVHEIFELISYAQMPPTMPINALEIHLFHYSRKIRPKDHRLASRG